MSLVTEVIKYVVFGVLFVVAAVKLYQFSMNVIKKMKKGQYGKADHDDYL